MSSTPRIFPSSSFHLAGLPYPTSKNQVDYMLRTRRSTGMPVIRKGRRIFIDVDQFLAWLASHAEVQEEA